MQITKILVGATKVDFKDAKQKWFKILIYVDENNMHHIQIGSLLKEIDAEKTEELLDNYKTYFK